MKSVLISIKPKWCELIASGEKTIEVRKTIPKIGTPFKVYIYCTNGLILRDNLNCDIDNIVESVKSGEIKRLVLDEYKSNNVLSSSYPFVNRKVIGELICDRIDTYLKGNSIPEHIKEKLYKESCLSCKEIYDYVHDKTFYTWHISQLNIYKEPKELSEFSYKAKEAVYGNSITQKPFMYVEQTKKLKRPPQSWCYVEEII